MLVHHISLIFLNALNTVPIWFVIWPCIELRLRLRFRLREVKRVLQILALQIRPALTTPLRIELSLCTAASDMRS